MAITTSRVRQLRGSAAIVLALVTMPLGGSARPLAAQENEPGVVSGIVTITERRGERSRDLNDAVIWLESLEGSGRPGAPTTVPIVMAERRYTPKVRLVPVGSTVEFPNQDPFRHNVFAKSAAFEFDLGLYDRGEVRRSRFATAGVHPIFCNIHARMVAFVVAVPTAWATQAEAGGRFRISGVPAGRYRLRAWHNRGGEHARELQVQGAGVHDVAVSLDARAYHFVQHHNKFGQPYPPDGTHRY